MKTFAMALCALGLAACGRTASERNQAALDAAAEQSTPEAAEILRNAADRGQNVQDAMQNAGNAQVENRQ